jgi:hypothetical protein
VSVAHGGVFTPPKHCVNKMRMAVRIVVQYGPYRNRRRKRRGGLGLTGGNLNEDLWRLVGRY